MGSFFTNVQVRGASIEPLIDAIRASARDAGLDEVGGGSSDPVPDRVVHVLPPDAGGWIAVYDEATESQDVATLEALGTLASRALDTHAFSVLVHDSDVLDLRLYERGARIDRYDSCPGYFGDRPSKRAKEEAAGQPDRWRPLLIEGASVDDLRAAWTGGLHAEAVLARTCELVGCDSSRAFMAHRYLGDLGVPDGALKLAFRSRVRPQYERAAEGPPSLEAAAYPGDAPLRQAIGDALRVGFSTRNVGGASTGLSVVVWGSALDAQLVELDRFEVLIGDVMSGARHEHVTPEATRSTTGQALRVARLPDRAIPAGSAATMSFGPGVDVTKLMQAMQASTVHVNVLGRVVKEGEGELHVALVPDANREGAGATQVRLAIDPPLPRPLRAGTMERFGGNVSHALRPLQGDRYLGVLVSFAVDRRESALVAREALTRALAVLGTGGYVQRATYHRAPAKRPGAGAGQVKTLLSGKRFEGLVDSMRDELAVMLEVRPTKATFDEEHGPIAASWGVAFGTGVIAMQDDERAPVLALFADTSSLESSTVHGLSEAWSKLVDEVAARDALLQATLFRSGWAPGMAGIGETPYESACDIDIFVVTLRQWSARWVRVPGNDRLWLGASLAAQLDAGARERLASIADVRDLGAGWRIALHAPSSAAALEEAIAALLPSAEDSHPVRDELFGRRRIHME
jgi:hypothetical protein